MLRRPVRGARPGRSHRPRPAGGRPCRPGPRCLRLLVQGPAPAGRPGQGAAQRPAGAVPGRADLRPGPGRRPRRARADRRAPPARRHDLPHHAPPRGGRAPLRPGRDPEHDPAHHRPARRAARSAVRQDARGQDRSSRSPTRPRLRRPAGRRRLARRRPRRYVLAVSDAAAAAPAVTRALVAAGADVLSISESRHSLEDVYLELVNQDQEASRR